MPPKCGTFPLTAGTAAGYPMGMTFLLFASCAIPMLMDTAGDAGPVAADTAKPADTAEGTEVDTATDLNGEWATVRTPAPEFVATNRDGSARSRPDLVGHPTVIWFYPAAGTSG